MNRQRLRELLLRVQNRETDLDAAIETLRRLPYDVIDDVATLDRHRELRSGVPEVVYGESKSAEEIVAILRRLAASGDGALATRVSPEKAEVVRAALEIEYHERARVCVVPRTEPRTVSTRGQICVVSAGTSDAPVAEEATLTARFLGHPVFRISDVGVAGLHRVLGVAEELRSAAVVICVAGMEGALPQVVASLIDRPVIAVPTSVGYGVGLGGHVAMLSMLAACSPGVTVVNIDNGFGAAVAAVRINQVRE